MIFITGWREAYLTAYEHYATGRGISGSGRITPDTREGLMALLKAFRYLVVPKEDLNTLCHSWLESDDEQYPGDNLASIFISDTFADTAEDPRRYLAIHVERDDYLWSEAYVDKEIIQLVEPRELSPFNFQWLAGAISNYTKHYDSSVSVYFRGLDQPSEVRWRRHLRIARDYDCVAARR